MQKDMDTIQFESRREIEEVMKVLEQHAEENQTVKELYDLLEVMHMEW